MFTEEMFPSSTWPEPRDVFDGVALLFVAHDPVVADLHAEEGAAGSDGAQMRRVALQFGQRRMTDQLDKLTSTALVDLEPIFRTFFSAENSTEFLVK
jgi:hypothetical protein